MAGRCSDKRQAERDIHSGIERQLDGRAQVGPDRLLDEQVEVGLLGSAEAHGAAGQPVAPLGGIVGGAQDGDGAGVEQRLEVAAHG